MGIRGAIPKLGRTPTPELLKLIENAAAQGATVAEIGAWLGVSDATMERFLARHADAREAIEMGRGKGRITLRRHQWNLAAKGNATMQIWLGKQMLGQREPKQVIENQNVEMPAAQWSPDNLTEEELLTLETLIAKSNTADGKATDKGSV